MTRCIVRFTLATIACCIVTSPVAAAVGIGSNAPPPNEPLSLWYKGWATNWVEALPIGNGRLGGMVFGRLDQEKIQLNEDTFWSGQPYTPTNGNALAALPQARTYVFNGQYSTAESYINSNMRGNPAGQAKFQPIGDLNLSFPLTGTVTNYRRDLNLDTAIASMTYQQNGVTFLREIFSSPVDNVMVMRISADQSGKVHFSASFSTPQTDNIVLGTAGGDTLVLHGDSGGSGPVSGDLPFESRVKIVPQGGTMSAAGNTLTVTNANSALIFIDAATAFKKYNDISGDPTALATGRIAAAAVKTFDQLRTNHIAEHQRLFRRVNFDLGTTPAASAPTDERLQNFKNGANDPHLATLYYQFGRYLLISSSRPGTQPANLQGIWNDLIAPPWDSKYTININIEMNYWPAETANLSELTEPLTRMVKELAETGTNIAQVHYGAGGWVSHHNTDLWRAAAPIDPAFYGMWPSSGAWFCTHLWEHFQFTLDTNYLADVYPVMKGSAQFFLDTLVPDPAHTNWLVTCPSISPENAHPFGSSICAGPTMDMGILRDLFAQTARAGEILGLDAAFRTQLTNASARLVPFQIGAQGQLQEWKDDWDAAAPEQQHRHISHLYGLFPSAQIDLRKTPELAAAAATSLNTRGDFSTGWAIAWRINCWARLHQGDRTYNIVRALLDPSRTYPNLFDAHPPFQIDGNFGGTSGMTEMLLQSHAGEIEFLPALPSAWPGGAITGLRARGGFEVDIHWGAGRLTSATIRSVGGTSCIVRYGAQTNALTLTNGQSVVFIPDLDDNGMALRSMGGIGAASADDAGGGAGVDKAFDRFESTSWSSGNTAASAWLQYQFSGPAWAISQYKLVSSTNSATADPRDWELLGSNDGSNWTALDGRTNETFASRTQAKRYAFPNTTPYRFYRLNVTATAGGVGSGVRLAEFQLWSEDTDDAASASAESAPAEGAAKAFDGFTTTKWFNANAAANGWLQYKFGGGAAWVLSQYALTSANDTPNRDPRDWQLQASNDGAGWVNLDTRAGETFASRFLTKPYSFANTAPYRFYRLNITANFGGGGFGLQLGEFDLGPAGVLTNAPGGVVALAGPVPNSVSLGWNALSNAVIYNVRRAGSSGGPYVTVASGLTNTAFTDHGLATGNYYYVVSGANSSGVGPDSSPVLFVMAPGAPAVPANLSATAGSGQVMLDWNSSQWAMTYNVKRSTASGGPYTTVATGLSNTDYLNAGLVNGSTYYYVVSASNAFGSSGNSAEVSALPLPVQESNKATGGTASASSQNPPNEIAARAFDGDTNTKWFTSTSPPRWLRYNFGTGITWAINRYDVSSANDVPGRDPRDWEFQGSSNGMDWTTLDTRSGETFPSRFQTKQYTIANTTPYQYYRLNILANQGGSGVGVQLSELALIMWSSSATPPPVPGNFTATPGDAQAALKWNASTNAAGYNIRRGTVSGGPYSIIASAVTATNLSDTGLTNGTTYYYLVSATNATGESAFSIEASAKPMSATLPQLNFGVSGGLLQLNWPSEHIGWRLEMQTNSIGAGLGANWATISGASATNQFFIPINLLDGSVFFRLVYP